MLTNATLIRDVDSDRGKGADRGPPTLSYQAQNFSVLLTV
jgi:hypothetical protein